MKTCSKCSAESYRVESKFCLKCGNPFTESDVVVPNINICTNGDCDFHKTKFIYPDDARFCDVCGTATAYNN